ncbi:MAG: Ig family protein, partial [Rhizobacter sp.]|nr:Ig family protein [Rhizobacter sp.]
DLLDGAAGNDWLEGGLGDDVYRVDSAGDRVVESANQGLDTVQSSIGFTLGNNLEDLVLVGAAAVNGTGNGLANHLTGNTANNTLDGGLGADTLQGGAADDTYLVDNAQDQVMERANEGADTVRASVSHVLSAEVENLVLTGSVGLAGTGNAADNRLEANEVKPAGLFPWMLTLAGAGSTGSSLYGMGGNDVLQGAASADTLDGGTGDDQLFGAGGADKLFGGAGNDRLDGNDGDDVLDGGDGNDTLDGGAGFNQLRGGSGDDTYRVGFFDTVEELAGGGTDTVLATGGYTLGANVENLRMASGSGGFATGNALNNELAASDVAGWLDGRDGNDTLRGGAGADNLYGGNGDDVLQGAGGADWLRGEAGADALDGGAGADWLYGGDGSDQLQGGTEADWLYGDAGNDVLDAGSGADWLYGGQGNDTLRGGADVDWLYGDAGNDLLDGGTGADAMSGGAGDDTYRVDNAGDTVSDMDGLDTVIASVNHTLGFNVDNLTLDGPGYLTGRGNDGNNQLRAGTAGATLDAAGGNDLLFGSASGDALYGGGGNDVLIAGGGDDILFGRNDTDPFWTAPGNDLLLGGSGNDVITTGAPANWLGPTPGAALVAGGAGNDTLRLRGGSSVIAFNRGDGADVVISDAGSRNTLSFGKGIAYADLALTRSGNDLQVLAGGSDSIVLKDWYVDASHRTAQRLQVFLDDSNGYIPGSADKLRNRRAEQFDLSAIVGRFDQARSVQPALSRWAITDALLTAHLEASDSQAIGGELADGYARSGDVASVWASSAQQTLADPRFAQSSQSLKGRSTALDGADLRLA